MQGICSAGPASQRILGSVGQNFVSKFDSDHR